jgi:hypothetical protein
MEPPVNRSARGVMTKFTQSLFGFENSLLIQQGISTKPLGSLIISLQFPQTAGFPANSLFFSLQQGISLAI